MIARMQQAFVLLSLVAALTWYLVLSHLGYVPGAILGAAAILLSFPILLAFEFVLLGLHGCSRTVQKPSPIELLAALGHEVITAPVVFCWRQPFRSNAMPDLLSSGALGRRGVLLVHGLFCNRGFWHPWLKVLRERRIPYVAVTLEPPFDSIERYANTLEAAVRTLTEHTGLSPVVVAHSMGGLAVRQWLTTVREDSLPVHRTFTIGSPHQGTWMARFSRTTNGRQMRQGSEWLTDLRSRERRDVHQHFVCYFSNCDNIVFPAECATLPQAENRLLTGRPHVAMAFDPVIRDAVLKELEMTSTDIGVRAGRLSAPARTDD